MKISDTHTTEKTGIWSAARVRQTLRNYYYLTKPGIIRGNLFTASAGFFLAAQGTWQIGSFAAMLAGLALIIAAGCVCNNYMDRAIDLKMTRTAKRALVTGAIGSEHALAFAAVLGVLGILILAFGTNPLTAALGAFGFIAYVVIYGIAKRTTVHSTVIGSISGAVPPLVGFAALGHGLGIGAWLLFAVLVCWQMPHFYAIALYRFDDYSAANLPVLPAVKGFANTRVQIILYTMLLAALFASLSLFGVTSTPFGVVMTIIASAWLFQALRGLRLKTDDETAHWARQIFGSSLLVITLFCVLIALDSFF
jgi:protoheme IX farnesyltransferase